MRHECGQERSIPVDERTVASMVQTGTEGGGGPHANSDDGQETWQRIVMTLCGYRSASTRESPVQATLTLLNRVRLIWLWSAFAEHVA